MRIHILCITLLCSCTTKGQELKPEKILSHIQQLSKDELGGRATGSSGESAAANYIVKEFSDLKLIPKGDNNSFFQAFTFSKGVHGTGEQGETKNIIGFLDNKAKTTVIIGAHYDHLGDDGQGSSLDPNPKNKIHNGADDNASGVAGVIELARYFANNKKRENNNFMFVCFSGEELGLLGSKFFTEHAPFDLTTADFMINMDMIGRLNEQTKSLMINGTGTSPVWEPLLKKIDTGGLNITTDSSGTGPSDHTSFYLKNIPVLHFFTGSHSDYHKPSDDVEKINAAGEAEVLKIIIRVIESLDDELKLTFLKTKTKMAMSQSSFKVTMGIMPSYAGGVEGLKVDGVSEGKPAAAAGIKTGDVIIKIGDFEVKDIYGYMDALGKFEKGQTVPVTIRREKEIMEVKVTF
jgi:Zn-dependent M28 family amino/carboxypeptidase